MKPQILKPTPFSHSNRRKVMKLTTRQTELHRASIETSKTLKALQDYRDGTLKLEPGQVRACEILLAKTMPNLSASEVTNINQDDPSTMSDADLEAIIQASKGTVEPIKGKAKG